MIDLVIKRPDNLKNDILSGLTVSLALVPEAVAFAFVAEVSPSVGLWAAFFVGFITSIVGGRPGMISGATGAMAVVMTAFVIMYGLEYLFAAVILCGIFQIACGVLKLGKFVRLIPHPVMLGFVNGLAIVIGLAQLGQLKHNHEVQYNTQTASFEVVGQWMTGSTLMITVGLILLTMAIIHYLPKFTKAVPGTLAAIVIVTTLVQLTPIHSITVQDYVDSNKQIANEKNYKSQYFDDIKQNLKFSELDQKATEIAAASMEIPLADESRKAGSFAIPSIPFNFNSLTIILGLALTLAAIGLIESLMTLTLIDELTETRGNGNRECIGQGLANIVSGFFGSMGGCAMIGQSMINIRSGGRSRISGISASLFLLCFILFPPLWTSIGKIPVAALVGVMFIVVIATFEWTSLRLWNKIPRNDFIVIVLVSSMTVLFDLAIAVAAGVIFSALVFSWKKSQRINAEIRNDGETKIYALDGPLFFGAITNFKSIFTPADDPETVVIEFENCRVYDHSAIEAINGISEKYKELNKNVRLRHLSTECQKLINKASGIIEVDVCNDPKYRVATDQTA